MERFKSFYLKSFFNRFKMLCTFKCTHHDKCHSSLHVMSTNSHLYTSPERAITYMHVFSKQQRLLWFPLLLPILKRKTASNNSFIALSSIFVMKPRGIKCKLFFLKLSTWYNFGNQNCTVGGSILATKNVPPSTIIAWQKMTLENNVFEYMLFLQV